MIDAMNKLLNKMYLLPSKPCWIMFPLVVLLFGLQGCKKEEFSYTNRYEGDWHFKLVEFNHPMDDTVNADLTEEYDGHIFDADENWLYFHLNRDYYVKLKIDEAGNIIDGRHRFYVGVPVGGFSDKKHFFYRLKCYDHRDQLYRIVEVEAEPR